MTLWLGIGCVVALVGLLIWGLAILIEAHLRDWP